MATRQNVRHPRNMRKKVQTITSTVLIFLIAGSFSYGQTQDVENATDAQIAGWIDQLNDTSYKKRERATRLLIEAADKSLPKLAQELVDGKNENSLERKIRSKRAFARILSQLDFDTNPRAEGVLKKLVESPSNYVSNMVKQKLGPEPDNATAAILAEWMKKRRKTKIEEVLELDDKILQRVKKSAAFEIKRSGPLRTQHWRRLADADQHQELLMYRVRWFKGNKWSRWFVPGVNDRFEQGVGKLYWNLFYDHTHETIKIKAKRGTFKQRKDFTKDPGR